MNFGIGIGIGIGWKVSVSVSKFGIGNSLNNYAEAYYIQYGRYIN